MEVSGASAFNAIWASPRLAQTALSKSRCFLISQHKVAGAVAICSGSFHSSVMALCPLMACYYSTVFILDPAQVWVAKS